MRLFTPAGSALLALIVLGCALVVVLLATTPWRTLAPAPASGPATGGAVAVEPLRDFTVAEKAREDAYHRAVRPPAYSSLVVALVVAGVLGLTPLGARLVGAAAAPFGGGWVWKVVVGTILVSAVGRVAVLPFGAWSEAVLRRYGLSTRSWGGWLADVTKGWLLATGLAVLALLALYALVRLAPQWWWAPAAVGGAGLVLVVSFLYPVVVEPVFNSFRSLEEGPLRRSLIELARADDVPVRDVLVADASRRTTALNAYVSGFGSTRRIVVYDTLLAGATPDEVRLVVAHELGHAKRRDVLYGTAVGALGMAAGVCLLYLLLQWRPLLRRAGVDSAADPRSLALVLLVVTVVMTATGPLQLLVSRRVEARADVHALALTADPAGFAAMQRRLAVTNLSDLDPHPLVFGLFASHPTAPQRTALAREWATRNDVRPPPSLVPAGSAG